MAGAVVGGVLFADTDTKANLMMALENDSDRSSVDDKRADGNEAAREQARIHDHWRRAELGVTNRTIASDMLFGSLVGGNPRGFVGLSDQAIFGLGEVGTPRSTSTFHTARGHETEQEQWDAKQREYERQMAEWRRSVGIQRPAARAEPEVPGQEYARTYSSRPLSVRSTGSGHASLRSFASLPPAPRIPLYPVQEGRVAIAQDHADVGTGWRSAVDQRWPMGQPWGVAGVRTIALGHGSHSGLHGHGASVAQLVYTNQSGSHPRHPARHHPRPTAGDLYPASFHSAQRFHDYTV